MQHLTESRKVEGFVHAVVSPGREFEVDVMAQGVQTAEQLEMLHDMGFGHEQGFLLARPMPAVQAQLALRRNFGNLRCAHDPRAGRPGTLTPSEAARHGVSRPSPPTTRAGPAPAGGACRQ